jgi:hypothetical protein
MDKQTDRYTDGMAGEWMDGLTFGQADRRAGGQAGWLAGGKQMCKINFKEVVSK